MVSFWRWRGEEIDRLITTGYVFRKKCWDAIGTEFGKTLVSKLVCIIHAQDDGS